MADPHDQLPDGIAGSIRRPYVITVSEWGDVTGGTVTGVIHDLAAGTTRAIAGKLELTTPASGVFTWTPVAADVVEGRYLVQFTCTVSAKPDRTYAAEWTVYRAYTV